MSSATPPSIVVLWRFVGRSGDILIFTVTVVFFFCLVVLLFCSFLVAAQMQSGLLPGPPSNWFRLPTLVSQDGGPREDPDLPLPERRLAWWFPAIRFLSFLDPFSWFSACISEFEPPTVIHFWGI